MNDIEKAIETLKDMRGYFNDRSHRQYSMPAIDTAISALEKQTAKKPVKDKEYTLCTNCKKVEIDWLDNYCHGCGQRLDWSVGE